MCASTVHKAVYSGRLFVKFVCVLFLFAWLLAHSKLLVKPMHVHRHLTVGSGRLFVKCIRCSPGPVNPAAWCMWAITLYLTQLVCQSYTSVPTFFAWQAVCQSYACVLTLFTWQAVCQSYACVLTMFTRQAVCQQYACVLSLFTWQAVCQSYVYVLTLFTLALRDCFWNLCFCADTIMCSHSC